MKHLLKRHVDRTLFWIGWLARPDRYVQTIGDLGTTGKTVAISCLPTSGSPAEALEAAYRGKLRDGFLPPKFEGEVTVSFDCDPAHDSYDCDQLFQLVFDSLRETGLASEFTTSEADPKNFEIILPVVNIELAQSVLRTRFSSESLLHVHPIYRVSYYFGVD